MALSIDPATYVITVPKADMLLVQSTPIEIRELNLDTFRLNLKDWEDSVEGIVQPVTHTHNTTVTISGVQLARVVEILEPYTITFENGAYAVNLVGANSNVADKVNLNFVSVRAANSAGLIQTREIEYASFNDGVTVDVVNGISGTAYPQGTPAYPVDNLADAVFIANLRGFVNLYINESMTLADEDISSLHIQGRSHVNTVLTIAPSLQCEDITISNANVIGTLDGGTHIQDCNVGTINYVNGHIHNSGLYGTITLAGGEDAVIVDCKSIDQDSNPVIDMGGSGQDLAMPNFSGIITVENFSDATGEIGIGLDAGMVILDSTITAGSVIVSGVGILQDNTTGTTVVNTDGLMSKDTIAHAVWDEPIAEHTLENTMGHQMYHDAYNGIVHIDTVNGTSGTGFPIGTAESPVDNFEDAYTIATAHNFDTVHIIGSLTLNTTNDVAGLTIAADRSTGNSITLTSYINTGVSYFQDITVSGTLSGSTRFTTCVMGALSNFDGGAKNCLLTGDIDITGTGANYFTDCDTYITNPANKVNIAINDTLLNIIRCRGGYNLTDKLSTTTTAVDLVAGLIDVDSSCTAGTIFIGGIVEVEDDSSSGCDVIVKSLSHDAISEAVWDEPLTGATHNLPTSAGRRVRQLSSSVVWEGTAQGAGINGNQIVLDTDAADYDGAYDPSAISITEGTGIGQTRLILAYKGSTRTATVDRDWKIQPSTDSVFVINADPGREHINEGLAQTGGTNTITLNSLASAIDNQYVGQVVFIRSGTGQDQAQRVLSYDGTTKIATMCKDWFTQPDSTSAYVMLPTGTLSFSYLADAVWDASTGDYTTAGTTGKALSDAGSSGNPWSTPLAGNNTPNTFGWFVQKLLTVAKFLGLK